MPDYFYRIDTGNGDYLTSQIVELTPQDDPSAALKALLANEHEDGSIGRSVVQDCAEVENKAGQGFQAVCHEGPDGATESGAPWQSAQLNPVGTDPSVNPARFFRSTLKARLSARAYAFYQNEANKNG